MGGLTWRGFCVLISVVTKLIEQVMSGVTWVREHLEIHPLSRAIRATRLSKVLVAFHLAKLIIQGFYKNRCPVRAAALSYTTLLAVVPLLAVVLSVSKNFLHERTASVVPQMLDRAVALVAPQLEYMPLDETVAGPVAPGQATVSSKAREEVVAKIQDFIGNIDAGALGIIGSVFLVFVGIRLLTTIEATFNDIWGVQKGRSIWKKVVYYWTTITFGPLMLLAAVAVTGSLELSSIRAQLSVAPWIEKVVLRMVPFVLLWGGFTLMYMLMPNTHVKFRAALAGGIVGGTLWQLNSLLSTLYVSRVVTYSKIYGALGIVPVVLVGLYFSWLIVMLGAQVSFAAQNIRTYLQMRASERIDQEGRELLACRMVLHACASFLNGREAPTTSEVAERLDAPLQLLNALMGRLVDGGILSEVGGDPAKLQPARPPETITVADVLHVARSADGKCCEKVLASGTDDLMGQHLCALYETERTSPANLSFKELAERSQLG